MVLGVRDEKSFPLIFYRTDCADAALDESDIDEAFVSSAGAIVVTGTHFSRDEHRGGAEEGDAYRPCEWAAGGLRHRLPAQSLGPRRAWGWRGALFAFRARDAASAGDPGRLRSHRRHGRGTAHRGRFRGHAAGLAERAGAQRGDDRLQARPDGLRRVSRPRSPRRSRTGSRDPGFPVEVYNVLGAGDAFLSGFLRGWLRDEPVATCCAYANACGAFAVSRLLCSPESPTWTELQFFLANGSPHRALRKDETINHVHWATTRRPESAEILALAIDHRAQLEEMADAIGAPRERIAPFKRLAVEATARVAAGRPGFGMLLDGIYGREAMFRAADHQFWIGRPVEKPGSRPVEAQIEGSAAIGAKLPEWPVIHTVKMPVLLPPRRPAELKREQERELRRVFDAARTVGRELLVEIIAGKHGALGDRTVATRPGQALCARHQAGLVEAGAAAKRGRLAGYPGQSSRRRSAVPRRRDARPRCAGG